MDLIDLGCAAVRAPGVDGLMRAASALGNGLMAGGAAAIALLLGVAAERRALTRFGGVALAAIVASGLLVNLVKLLLAWPRPNGLSLNYGFPSGHTATVFALAAVLACIVPRVGPGVFLVATLTGVARLYLQAHFTVDVLGGALLGSLTGLLTVRGLWSAPRGQPLDPRRRLSWSLPILAAVLSLPFFFVHEQIIASQRSAAATRLSAVPAAVIAFGTPAARPALRTGWSNDERWDGRIPFVWAQGREAGLEIPALPLVDYRLRLRLVPFDTRRAISCQRVEVAVNGRPAGRLVLDRGWHDYEVLLPGGALRAGPNQVSFRFAVPGRVGGDPDPRPLSVGFAKLAVLSR